MVIVSQGLWRRKLCVTPRCQPLPGGAGRLGSNDDCRAWKASRARGGKGHGLPRGQSVAQGEGEPDRGVRGVRNYVAVSFWCMRD